ncbi:MAG TPA: hypothetical protein VH374_24985 [Polyangia bacterium]|jgi:CRISPR/Cas system CMR subunit Cmr6 (Cas7 group RAMP superfamily)|nr:hypothetical protein [Polyangia bacterium]
MTAAATTEAADEIEAALAAIAEELQVGDVVKAAESVQALVASCQAAGGQRLKSEQIVRLRSLLERCTDLANAADVKLNTALRKFGIGGRARRAYGVR